MLHLSKLRELNLTAGSDSNRPAYISAASGLVVIDKYLYVVADDELHLGVFPLETAEPGILLRLFPGELPDKPKKRKKRKPDLEVLTRLPPFGDCSQGALLALGSGSTDRRCRGVVLPLNKHGHVHGAPRVLDTSAWFNALQRQFTQLNLEGAFVSGDSLCLLQRGTKAHSPNAVLRCALSDVLSALQHETLPAFEPQLVRRMSLGDINGVPLCFSDGCALSDGNWLFTAVAEDTDNAVSDGEFFGAAIGMANAQDEVVWLQQVTPDFKIEGIEARQTSSGIELLLVTDADTPDVPSCLLRTLV